MRTEPIGAITRVIFFAKDVPALARFYRDTLGLPIVGDAEDQDWVECDAGACRLALHRGKPTASGPKLVFGVRDVRAARKRLVGAGVTAGEVISAGKLQLCDFRDPAGNRFQLSNRGMA